MDNKLKVKDLISVGIFGAMYIIVMMITVTALGTIPILYILAPFFVAIICATIYMLFVMKVPKTGSVFILSILMAFIFLGAGWHASIWSITIGLITELVLLKGHQSKKRIDISFCIFATTTVGPYFGILFNKSYYIQRVVDYYGQIYADKLDKLTPLWIAFPLIGIAIIGGLIGVKFGNKILGKHFKRAGVI
ncbi:MptD family putative ECF transporter S component [Clostridiaceae bacterium M8S5]|nr:MptD family putative ECF transporter S component [Clostridiaceae bacterium M8S5]